MTYSWSFSYNSFVKFHDKTVWSHNMTVLWYIQICAIMRCVIKRLQCILFFFNRDLMQLESCIFTNLSVIYPTFTPTVSLYHIPPALRELFKSYKENGHQLLRESMTKMARCDSEKENGCSGHSYGLIVCESSGNLFFLNYFLL